MPHTVRLRGALTAACLAALVSAAPGRGSPGDGPDAESIRRDLKQSWDSLQSIKFRCDEYGIDKDGRRTTEYAIRVDFAHAKGGRWAYAARSTRGDVVVQLATDVREDGKKLRILSEFPGHPEAIHNVVVRSQADDDWTYSAAMQTILWLWIPGGRPPIAHLDAGGTLEVTKVDGKPRAVIHATYKEGPLRIELDPDHDWLPRRVVLEDGSEFEATKFRRDNGRWFYEEGRERKHHGPASGAEAGEIVAAPEGDASRGFVVTSLTINRPIDPSPFSLPKLEAGVVVQDQTTGKDEFVGGAPAAYQARVTKYGTKAPASSASPIVASVDPPGDSWGRPILFASAAALVTAGFLLARRSRQRI